MHYNERKVSGYLCQSHDSDFTFGFTFKGQNMK